jgi:hypothetical protein
MGGKTKEIGRYARVLRLVEFDFLVQLRVARLGRPVGLGDEGVGAFGFERHGRIWFLVVWSRRGGW